MFYPLLFANLHEFLIYSRKFVDSFLSILSHDLCNLMREVIFPVFEMSDDTLITFIIPVLAEFVACLDVRDFNLKRGNPLHLFLYKILRQGLQSIRAMCLVAVDQSLENSIRFIVICNQPRLAIDMYRLVIPRRHIDVVVPGRRNISM